MRTFALRVALAALLVSSLSVAPLTAQSAPAPIPQSSGSHMLWRVTASHGGTAYLLGSIHVARDDLFPLPGVYDEAFEAAEFVAFEIDPEKVLSMTFAMMRRGFFWDGRTLEGELSAETWERLQEHAAAQGLDLGLFRRAKPWLVSLLLAVTTMEQQGYTGAAGIDQTLSDRAQRAGKERRFLETADEQFLFFDGFSKRQQELLVRSALEEAEVESEEIDEITEAWKDGDVEALDRLLKDSGGDIPGFLDRLLIQRNRNWVPKIEGWLTEGEPFLVVVGAGHLVGDDSVVDLLREEGYRVDRM